MLALKQFLAPPTFEDEEKTHQAYLLSIILSILITLPIPFVIYTLIQKTNEFGKTLVFIAILEIANFTLFIMLKRGYVRQASVLQLASIWLILAAATVTSSSIYGVAYTLGNALTITMAGILLGGRSALAMTLLATSMAGSLRIF